MIKEFSYTPEELAKFKSMRAPARREAILEMVRIYGAVRTSKLSKIFKVSKVTIRLDLERLSQKGVIVREAGGAYLKSVPDLVRNIPLRNVQYPEQSIAIARAAVKFIEKGDNIILDSGPTTTEIARLIQGRQDNLTIITSGLNIGLMLGSERGEKHGTEVIFTGGHFKPMSLSNTGEITANFFEHIHANKLFLSAGGITMEGGLNYPHHSDIPVKKAMIRSADIIYLVIPSYMMGRKMLASLGEVPVVDFLITDSGIPTEYKAFFKEQNIEVIIGE
jgi:DeoR/GlpR family transcriptional regulator of sugar metabolism